MCLVVPPSKMILQGESGGLRLGYDDINSVSFGGYPETEPDSENEGEITIDKGDRRSLATFLGSARPAALATLRPGSR